METAAYTATPITFRPDADTSQNLRQLAEQYGLSLSATIRRLINTAAEQESEQSNMEIQSDEDM